MTNFFIFVSHFFHALVIYDLRHGDSFANQFKSVKICNFRILFQEYYKTQLRYKIFVSY